MNEMDSIFADLATMPVEQVGAVLCAKAGLLAAKTALQHFSAVHDNHPASPARWRTAAVVRHGGARIEQVRTGEWRLEAGSASMGACAAIPDLLMLPLSCAARPDVLVCLPITADADSSVMHRKRGPRLAGFGGCTHDRLIWQTTQPSASLLLETAPQAPCWYAAALAAQAQLGLAAMRVMARRALRIVVRFLDQRCLYGQMASTLPQVEHSLAEVELRLLLAEAALREADGMVDTAQRAVHARVRDMTMAAIALLGVLLGARGFMCEGAEARFQALQQTAQTIALAFADHTSEACPGHCPLEEPAWTTLGVPPTVGIRLWRDDDWDPSSPVGELLTMQRHRLAAAATRQITSLGRQRRENDAPNAA